MGFDSTVRAVRPSISSLIELLAAQTADTADVVALPGARELLARLPVGSWGLVTACDRRLAEAAQREGLRVLTWPR